MKFNYEAFDKLGQPVKDSVEASSEEEAAQIIRQERGHYARVISTEEVQTRFETPAVGGVVSEPPAEDDVSEIFATNPSAIDMIMNKDTPETKALLEQVKPTVGTDKPVPQTTSKDDQKLPVWNEILRKELEDISEVLRQMVVWEKEYRDSLPTKDVDGNPVSEGHPLPAGVPKVGSKTWECYHTHFDAVTEHLFKTALERAVTMR